MLKRGLIVLGILILAIFIFNSFSKEDITGKDVIIPRSIAPADITGISCSISYGTQIYTDDDLNRCKDERNIDCLIFLLKFGKNEKVVNILNFLEKTVVIEGKETNKILNELIKILYSTTNEDIKTPIIYSLIHLAQNNIEVDIIVNELIRILNSDIDEKIKLDIIYALGKLADNDIRSTRVSDVLLEILDNDIRENVKIKTIEALGDIAYSGHQSEKIVTNLVSILYTNRDNIIAEAIINLLYQMSMNDIESEKISNTLFDILNSNANDYIKAKIISILGVFIADDIQPQKNLDLLISIIGDTTKSDTLRKTSALALENAITRSEDKPSILERLINVLTIPQITKYSALVLENVASEDDTDRIVNTLIEFSESDLPYNIKQDVGSYITIRALDFFGIENKEEVRIILKHIVETAGPYSNQALRDGLPSLLGSIEGEVSMEKIIQKIDESMLLDFTPEILPYQTQKVLLKKSIFKQIYNSDMIKNLKPYERYSTTLAVYRSLITLDNPNDHINFLINFILKERSLFADNIILGPETYLITFSHEDDAMQNEPIKRFAKQRGVTDIIEDDLKGSKDKNKIKDAIINSKYKGKTTIWINVHGQTIFLALGSRSGFSYYEFANILIQRGNLNEVTLIIDACFSYNFAEELIKVLERSGSSAYPTIITETNKGKFGYMGVFLGSLNSLSLKKNEPLLGRHIYDAEKFSQEKQDSAVFSSERGLKPLEIALNNLEHNCCGDVCYVG